MIKMNPIDNFNKEKTNNISEMGNSPALKKTALEFIEKTAPNKYSYNFTWMGRPIIAFPQDMIAMQEIIWEVKPDLIIETGVAHGGSVIYYASLLELIGENGLVVGIDIDIREHNRKLIESHSMFKRIHLVEGSSVSEDVIKQVIEIASTKKRIMVCLDSNHTHSHVLDELRIYSPLVTLNSYCVVFDTVIEELPADFNWNGRPWGRGNNPKTAVFEFLKTNDNFEIDKSIENKLLITVASEGYLKRFK